MRKLLISKEVDDFLEKIIDDCLSLVVEKAKEDPLTHITNPDEYKSHFRDQFLLEIEKCTKEFNEHFTMGIKEIFNELDHSDEGKEIKSRAMNEMQEAISSMMPLKTHAETIGKRIDEEASIHEFLGLSSTTINDFYGAAYSLHSAGKFEQASNCFYFLCAISPMMHELWDGYGHSEQMVGHYDKALLAYAISVQINSTNPLPHLLAAQCYQKMGDTINALDSAELSINTAEAHGNMQFLEEAKKLKSEITNK